MEISSLKYISGFPVKFFFQPIYTDFAYLEKIFCYEIWAEMIFDPRWQP
jgi:hypothetical protein